MSLTLSPVNRATERHISVHGVLEQFMMKGIVVDIRIHVDPKIRLPFQYLFRQG